MNSSLSLDERSLLLKQLVAPPGMSLRVEIENPQVILKPSQASKDSLIIDLGHILVTNKRSKSTERVKLGELSAEGVWVDTFMVVMKNLCMFE